jgi:hypothetical protein
MPDMDEDGAATHTESVLETPHIHYILRRAPDKHKYCIPLGSKMSLPLHLTSIDLVVFQIIVQF